MKKTFRTGGLVFTIDETDVRWSSSNQTGGLPINTILSINYGSGVITLVCNGFVEKIPVPDSGQSRVAAIQMNNCIASIKEGDLGVLESDSSKAGSGSSWKITKGGWWAIGIAGFFLFSYIMKEKEAYEKESKANEEKAAYEALTQPQKDSVLALQEREKEMVQFKERQKRLESAFSAWDGSHIQLARAVKKSMNDPGSYEHVETRFVDKGDDNIVVTMKFRGKNAFGGKVVNTVKARTAIDGSVLKVLE